MARGAINRNVIDASPGCAYFSRLRTGIAICHGFALLNVRVLHGCAYFRRFGRSLINLSELRTGLPGMGPFSFESQTNDARPADFVVGLLRKE